MAHPRQVSVDDEDTVSRETFRLKFGAASSFASGPQPDSGSHVASEALRLEPRPVAADRGG